MNGMVAAGAVMCAAAAMRAKDPNTYVLKEKDNQKIFDRLIVPEELAHLKYAGHLKDGYQPIVVFVVGQTGSGKTRLAADLLGVMQGRQPAHLIADVYKTYHPKYKTVIKEYPHIATPATSIDARKWLELATNWTIQHKVDVVLESACRHPDDLTSLVSAFYHADYRVLVAVMAVPECLSLLGTMVRYYERLPEAKSAKIPLRITPRGVHDETYDGMLAVADFIDKSAAVTNVVVVRRNNLVAYQNFRGPGGLWMRPAGTLTSLDLERTRPLPATEHGSFHADYLYVEEQKSNKQKTKKHRHSKGGVADAPLDDVDISLACLMSMGDRLSSSFPTLKPLDADEWVFGEWDVNEADPEIPEEREAVEIARNSILQESARVQH